MQSRGDFECIQWFPIDHPMPIRVDDCMFLDGWCVEYITNRTSSCFLDIRFMSQHKIGYPLDSNGEVSIDLYKSRVFGVYLPIEFKFVLMQDTDIVYKAPHKILGVRYVDENIVKMSLLCPNLDRGPTSKRWRLFDEQCKSIDVSLENTGRDPRISKWVEYLNNTFLKHHDMYITRDDPTSMGVRIAGESIMVLWR
jgi:hypothetical protein